MADVITRFKLETTQFDSKLRDTSKALRDIAHQAELGGKDFDKFSDEAIKSARALGTVQSGATNTKDKLKDLVGSYNDAAKAYNSLTDAAKKGEFGKAMSQSLTQLQQRIKETKQEIYSLGDNIKGGGGLFGGGKLDGMLQVFGGNVMTKIASMGAGLVTELGDAVKQGIELARAGEGIRNAFERLGRGDILDGLRQATHGTVTDLELMKAAVKFNDFKLPLEELGTMLAFAQQKAKDTGQSVDYMVDSIVTGLGRKSLMILDNLGLSATEIRDKMKETGDMTKAVGEIIREQMSKAGDYVETAADRAAQANVSLQNKMEELGRKFAPVEEASNQLWTSIKIGILDIVGGPLAELLNGLTEAGRLRNELNNINGSGENNKVDNELKKLKAAKTAGASNYILKSMQSGVIEGFNREIINLDTQIKKLQRKAGEDMDGNMAAGIEGKIKDLTTRQNAYRTMIANYQSGASGIMNGTISDANPLPVKVTPTGGGGGTTSVNLSPFVAAEGERAIEHQEFVPMWNTADFMEALRKEMGMDGEQTRDWGKEIGQVFADYVADPDKEKRDKANKADKGDKDLSKNISTLTSGITSLTSGIKGLGIDLPKEVDDVIGIITSLTSIIQGVQTIISIFGNTAMAANTAAIIANTAALTANTATNFLPFAHGGIVPHAANGYYVPGTHTSGDVTPILANAGELVLNKSSQGNLANDLKGAEALVQTIDRYQNSIMRGSQIGSDAVSMGTGLFGNYHLSTAINAEQIEIVMQRRNLRTGRSENIRSRFR